MWGIRGENSVRWIKESCHSFLAVPIENISPSASRRDHRWKGLMQEGEVSGVLDRLPLWIDWNPRFLHIIFCCFSWIRVLPTLFPKEKRREKRKRKEKESREKETHTHKHTHTHTHMRARTEHRAQYILSSIQVHCYRSFFHQTVAVKQEMLYRYRRKLFVLFDLLWFESPGLTHDD